MKTISEIETLKAQWEEDGLWDWDIEDTEGFEDHREELLAFRKQKELEADQRSEQRAMAKAEKLGCPGNIVLARYVERLENRLEALEERLEKLENI